MASWIFLEKRADRSATGDAFRNSFEGEDPVATLARESIQNSVDAVEKGGTPRLRYTRRSGVDLCAILPKEFWAHAEKASISSDLNPADAEVLYVEDFGTTGLTGSMSDLDSNFYRLMGQLGGSDKDLGAGGSFGYGKASCILNSRCWTVIAYTVTAAGSALFGATYMDQHKLEKSFTGLGWFCADGSTDSEPQELVGENADRLAESLGVPRAATRERGTTLVILFPSLLLADLNKCIERFWWPRLTDHTLTVELIENERVTVPNPNAVAALRDQIHLYEVIQKKSAPLKDDFVRQVSHNGRFLGTVALRFVDAAQGSEDDAEAAPGSIALMRNQRMVIDYYRWSQGPRPDLMGVFVADPGINDDLRRTESLRHDVWSAKATRATQAQRDLAKTVLDRIRKEYRTYLNQYTPPVSQDDASLKELKRFFGSLFSTKGKTGPTAKGSQLQIFDKQVTVDPLGDKLRLRGSATLRWGGKAPIQVNSGVSVEIADSDVSNSGDKIPVKVCAAGLEATGEPPSLALQVEPGEAVRLVFESEAYEADWTATATFFAEEVRL